MTGRKKPSPAEKFLLKQVQTEEPDDAPVERTPETTGNAVAPKDMAGPETGPAAPQEPKQTGPHGSPAKAAPVAAQALSGRRISIRDRNLLTNELKPYAGKVAAAYDDLASAVDRLQQHIDTIRDRAHQAHHPADEVDRIIANVLAGSDLNTDLKPKY
jgi:hypothetical protein